MKGANKEKKCCDTKRIEIELMNLGTAGREPPPLCAYETAARRGGYVQELKLEKHYFRLPRMCTNHVALHARSSLSCFTRGF